MGEANKIVLVVLPSYFPHEERQDLIEINLQARLKKKKKKVALEVFLDVIQKGFGN